MAWIGAVAAVLLAFSLFWYARTALVVFLLSSLDHHDGRYIPYALEKLRSTDPEIRQAAIRGLGRIGPDASSALPDLLIALHDPSSSIAAEAAWALGKIQSPDRHVIDELTSALDHENGEVRRYAAYALSLYGRQASSAVPALTNRLRDEHMRYMAARALGEMGSDANGAIPQMTKLLSSPNWADRAETAVALSKLSPLPAVTVTAMHSLLNDPREEVQAIARRALPPISISGQPAQTATPTP